MKYKDIHVHFETPSSEGVYPFRLSRSPTVGTPGELRLPLGDYDLDQRLDELDEDIPGTGGTALDENVARDCRELGKDLFEALFQGEAKNLYSRARGAVEDDANLGLRLTLHFDPRLRWGRELFRLPWELLRDPSSERPQPSRQFIVSRGLVGLHPLLTVPFAPPLRLLVASHGQADGEEVDAGVRRERERLDEAVRDLDSVEIEHVSPCLPEIHRRLIRNTFHAFHYLGHGFGSPSGKTLLEFVRSDGQADLIDGKRLAAVLAAADPRLKLVVLNACHSGRFLGGRVLGDPYGGVATSLVRHDLPAVVAMQRKISTDAAVAFSTGFYTTLARSQPLEICLAEGRRAILAELPGSLEWTTPILISRLADGHLFGEGETLRRKESAQASPETPPPPRTAKPAGSARRAARPTIRDNRTSPTAKQPESIVSGAGLGLPAQLPSRQVFDQLWSRSQVSSDFRAHSLPPTQPPGASQDGPWRVGITIERESHLLVLARDRENRIQSLVPSGQNPETRMQRGSYDLAPVRSAQPSEPGLEVAPSNASSSYDSDGDTYQVLAILTPEPLLAGPKAVPRGPDRWWLRQADGAAAAPDEGFLAPRDLDAIYHRVRYSAAVTLWQSGLHLDN